MQAIWIEIPVGELERATAFYEAVFGHEPGDVVRQDTRTFVVIPGEPTVSLNRAEGFTPSSDGALPYFHVDDLDAAVAAATAHGGEVLEPPAARGDLGRFALVTDSEGNALYLHGAG